MSNPAAIFTVTSVVLFVIVLVVLLCKGVEKLVNRILENDEDNF